MRRWAIASLLLFCAGCRTRLWDLGDAGPGADATPLPDLAAPGDLARPPDLAPPPDLVLPFVCRDIYVVDAQSKDLFGFDALTATFYRVGALDCPTRGNGPLQPETMAIGRDGYAYVFYGDGELFKASIMDARCEATPFDPRQINPSYPAGGGEFGSAFSADRPGGASETLYLALSGDGQLGRVDLNNDQVSRFGSVTVGELTGTAAAELWGLFIDTTSPMPQPTTIGRVDKQTGAIDNVIPVPQIVPNNNVAYGYAFAFWGGGFWVFYYDANTGGGDTTIYRVDRDTGEVKTIRSGTGRHIVGAGVSSCAPLGLDR